MIQLPGLPPRPVYDELPFSLNEMFSQVLFAVFPDSPLVLATGCGAFTIGPLVLD